MTPTVQSVMICGTSWRPRWSADNLATMEVSCTFRASSHSLAGKPPSQSFYGNIFCIIMDR